MSSVQCNVSALTARIHQVGDRATKGVSDVMRKYAKLIIYDIETRTAPRRLGVLEKSMIKIDHRGQNGRLWIEITVDPTAENKYGQEVAKYAELVNKYMRPAPGAFMGRGKGTIAKSPDAGGMFIRRSVQRWSAKLYSEVHAKVVRAALS